MNITEEMRGLVRTMVAATLASWDAQRLLEALMGGTVDNMGSDLDTLCAGLNTIHDLTPAQIDELLTEWHTRKEGNACT